MGERFVGVVGCGLLGCVCGGCWGMGSERSSHGFASVARASGVGRCGFLGLERSV